MSVPSPSFYQKGGKQMAAQSKSAKLDRKKLFSDPVMVGMISVLLIFLVLFIVYPLFVLLIDSVYTKESLHFPYSREFSACSVSELHFPIRWYLDC